MMKQSHGTTFGRSRIRSSPAPEAVKVEQQSYLPSGARTNRPMPMLTPMPMPMPTPSPSPTPTNSIPMAAAPVAEFAAPAPTTVAAPVPSLVEETVRNCVTPIFKELLNNFMNVNGPARGFGFGFGFGGMGMSPFPLGFGGGAMSMEMMGDKKWRKQQMLELEVYLKRLELIQEQVKAQLEELRSMESKT